MYCSRFRVEITLLFSFARAPNDKRAQAHGGGVLTSVSEGFKIPSQ